MTIGLPNNHADDLEKAVKKWANYYKVSVDFSAKQISDFLDGCFFSSLLQEEERSLTFRAAYISKEQCEERKYQTIQFEEPLIFSPERMKKLALIANHTSLSLCIGQGESGPEVWGLVLLQSLLGIDNYLLCPLVSILGPARLQFLFGPQTLLYYSAEKDYLVPEKCWTLHLEESLVAMRVDWRDNLNPLSCIANSIVRQAHGGTLLFAHGDENSFDERLQGGINITFDNPMELVSKKEQSDKKGEGQAGYIAKLERQMIDARYLAVLTSIGMFSAVDGAIILSSDWRTCGFGKTILVNEADMEERTQIVKVDPYKKTEQEFWRIRDYLGGTRHRSAIAFCKKTRDSLVIVVSQDTTVSLISSPSENKILVVTPFLPFEAIYDSDYAIKVLAAMKRGVL